MQSARTNPNARQRFPRYQRWVPPPEPKPEPKLDLSDKSFPTLPTSNVPQQSTGGHEFNSTFTATVRVMAEMEKLTELREQRNREASQKARAEMGHVYTHRFRPGRMTSETTEEEPTWQRPPSPQEPAEDEWTEVRHSKARKQPREKSMRELEEEYRSKAADEDAAEDYNGDLFERSHRHDHYAT